MVVANVNNKSIFTECECFKSKSFARLTLKACSTSGFLKSSVSCLSGEEHQIRALAFLINREWVSGHFGWYIKAVGPMY